MMNLAEYRRTATRLADYLPWVALVAEGVVGREAGTGRRCSNDLRSRARPRWMRERTVPIFTPRVSAISS